VGQCKEKAGKKSPVEIDEWRDIVRKRAEIEFAEVRVVPLCLWKQEIDLML
jgi:hypothetical protein